MTIDATASALVAETAAPSEMTEDEALDAAFDKAMEAPDETEDVPDPEKADSPTLEEVVDDDPAPSDIPAELQKAWKTIPKDTRDALAASQRGMSQKLAEQGRMMTGIAPIRDVLVQAVREMPNFANMRPEQVAAEVFALAKISRQFNESPVETLMGLIQKHNIGPQIAQALGQTPQPADAQAVQQKLARLEQQLQQAADPERVQQTVENVLTQRSVLDEVTKFAQEAEYWGVLEPHLPAFVQAAREELGDGASAKDVLNRAYDTALSKLMPAAKANAQAAVTSQPVPDPKKAEAVLKAKSVNVTSRTTGDARVRTEDELLDAAWERAHRK